MVFFDLLNIRDSAFSSSNAIGVMNHLGLCHRNVAAANMDSDLVSVHHFNWLDPVGHI